MRWQFWLTNEQVLHERNLIISVIVSMQPLVPDADRVSVEKLSDRFTRVELCFGYMEETNVSRALALVRKQGETFDIMSTSFFLNRRSFRLSKTKGLPRWQGALFMAMTMWATNATSFYRLPTNRVVELGEQFLI
jgi:KUP system potassium uptake protein